MTHDEIVDACALFREDELVVLDSLYPDQISVATEDEEGGRTLTVDLSILLATQTNFILQSSVQGILDGVVSTSILPTIQIRLRLPTTYPLRSSPNLVGIHNLHPSSHLPTESYLPLPTQSALSHKLRALWLETQPGDPDLEGGSEGECVLWTFLDWIATGAFLDDVEFGGLERDSAAGGSKKAPGYIFPLPPAYTPTSLSTLITLTLREAHTSAFRQTTYTCGICFENKKGRESVEMNDPEGCEDVFCLDCLKDCWTLAITEGSIQNVACPSFECTKRRVKAHGMTSEGDGASLDDVERTLGALSIHEGGSGVPSRLVERVVGKELADRWIWLAEKKRIENDATYVRCPMAHCQAPIPAPIRPASTGPRKSNNTFRLPSSKSITVTSGGTATDRERAREKDQLRRDEEEQSRRSERARQQEEDRFDRYRECGKCDFSFCRYCEQTWHGIHLPCPMPATQAFLQTYLSLPPNSPEKAVMQRRYGVKQLAKMVADWEEQEGNRQWMEANSSVCPGCSCRVEKSQGCNHMTCSKCNAHFCYRCSTALKPSDPYAHYRMPGQPCFERLFDVEEIRRFEREMAGNVDIGWGMFGNI